MKNTHALVPEMTSHFIRFSTPAADLRMGGFATQRSATILGWSDLASCLGIEKQSVEKSVTGGTFAAIPLVLTEVVRHGDAA
jgi:hypothetical protein